MGSYWLEERRREFQKRKCDRFIERFSRSPEDKKRISTGDRQRMSTDKGVKLDDGKVDMTYLRYFPQALKWVCKVCELGAIKYTRGGWKTVLNGEQRYEAAALRHALRISEDEDNWIEHFNSDENLMHVAQQAWNSLAQLELMIERINYDTSKVTTSVPSTDHGGENEPLRGNYPL